MSSVTTELPIVTVTEAARTMVLDMRSAETDGDGLALRIDITGIGEGGREFAYELMFEPVVDVREGDELRQSGELPVLIPADSIDRLRGATLDFTQATGLVIRNPNRPSPTMGSGLTVLEGSVEEKIVALLDGEINPSLAAHGGFANLQKVEGDTAFITMGGGCQGCGLAALTLGEGIKAQIEDRIPEIREVIDVTNHAAGENPFFEPSTK
ncbi:MAG: thioredoxin-like protein [Acidimicrobiales bacterium]|jgi:Fe/S biogenesis protein NfuA|nr:thioredoxin-like protein [Acidimicrobiales bacterium]